MPYWDYNWCMKAIYAVKFNLQSLLLNRNTLAKHSLMMNITKLLDDYPYKSQSIYPKQLLLVSKKLYHQLDITEYNQISKSPSTSYDRWPISNSDYEVILYKPIFTQTMNNTDSQQAYNTDKRSITTI